MPHDAEVLSRRFTELANYVSVIARPFISSAKRKFEIMIEKNMHYIK